MYLLSLARTLLGQLEHILYFAHGGVGHAVGGEAHALGAHVDVGGLVEHVNLVEGVHDVLADGADAVLLPHHDVVVANLTEGGFGEADGAGKFVGHDAEAEGCEGEGFGNHRPEQAGHHVLLKHLLVVRHGDEFDGMRVERCLVA